MFELVAGMEFGVVAAAGLPHFPEDLEPALAQGAQRAGMGFAAGTQRLIVDLSPRRALPGEVGPKMDGGTQATYCRVGADRLCGSARTGSLPAPCRPGAARPLESKRSRSEPISLSKRGAILGPAPGREPKRS